MSALQSVNPATGEVLEEVPAFDDAAVEDVLAGSAQAQRHWAGVSVAHRGEALRGLAATLRARESELAGLITAEMGKLLGEARGEVQKSAWACEYYADCAEEFLAPEHIATDASDSYVATQPLGVILAVMPWNFPLWQVMRAAAPALAAGNAMVLKHASNVPRCALAIESAFREAGFPEDLFRALLIPARRVEGVIADRRIRGVTLTGSEAAGRAVAAQAGRHLKKCVLELGGADAFIVLDDADLESTVATAATARFQNCGQSCIAAKRFIVQESVADRFVEAFRAAAEGYAPGDPTDPATRLAPMAREDLRADLHAQAADSVRAGARVVTGVRLPSGAGAYYPASIIDGVGPGMRAWSEELFGPVAAVIRVPDEAEAVAVANGSVYGLGGSVWTADAARGERVALALECGNAFVNGLVKSDPRLPFGGVKDSGYGRELSRLGLHELVNHKTVWIR